MRFELRTERSWKVILTGKEDYPITPDHIDTRRHFWDAFGNIGAYVVSNYTQPDGEHWEVER